MELLITDTKAIHEIQKEFSEVFPFLKLEFFNSPYEEGKAQPKAKMFPHDKKLSACRRLHNTGSLLLNKFDKVSDLEHELWSKFGLSAQVFRRSGNLWIETSLTDSWTLEQQNREGLEMTGTHVNPYKEADDLDLTDRDKWA